MMRVWLMIRRVCIYIIYCILKYLLCLNYSGKELSDGSGEDEQEIDTDSTDNPLIVTLGDTQKGSKSNRAAHVWFQKPLFAKLEDDYDMDTEVELSMRKLKRQSAGDNSGMMMRKRHQM